MGVITSVKSGSITILTKGFLKTQSGRKHCFCCIQAVGPITEELFFFSLFQKVFPAECMKASLRGMCYSPSLHWGARSLSGSALGL